MDTRRERFIGGVVLLLIMANFILLLPRVLSWTMRKKAIVAEETNQAVNTGGFTISGIGDKLPPWGATIPHIRAWADNGDTTSVPKEGIVSLLIIDDKPPRENISIPGIELALLHTERITVTWLIIKDIPGLLEHPHIMPMTASGCPVAILYTTMEEISQKIGVSDFRCRLTLITDERCRVLLGEKSWIPNEFIERIIEEYLRNRGSNNEGRIQIQRRSDDEE